MDLTVEDFQSFCYMKQNSDSLGHYMLVAQKENKLDFREVENLDCKWKTKFVMAHRLIDDPDYLRSFPFVWGMSFESPETCDCILFKFGYV